MRFDGKVAVVTGGASGIGRAAAELLAARGASVAILDRKESPGESVAAGIEARSGHAVFCPVEITQPGQVDSAIGKAREALGPIDVLVVSAGVQRYGNALTTTDEQWAEVLSVN